MSTTRDPETDQVAPTPNDKPAVWLEVIADMQERHAHGIRKYGTALQPHNGRDALRDLYEELLDAAVYTKQRQIEQADGFPLGKPVCGACLVRKTGGEVTKGPSFAMVISTLAVFLAAVALFAWLALR